MSVAGGCWAAVRAIAQGLTNADGKLSITMGRRVAGSPHDCVRMAALFPSPSLPA